MPPKNKKKDTKKKELTADDMRRLGMTEEDIARIIAERGKSSEDKKAEQEREEAQRKETEARQRAQRELNKSVDELVHAEAGPRTAILSEEDDAWRALEPPLRVEKIRALRAFFEKEAQRKTAEARQRRAAELEEWKVSLEGMSEEERARMIAEQEEKERARQEEAVRQEHERQAKEQRREARRAARAERLAKQGLSAADVYLLSLVSDDDEESGGLSGKVKKDKYSDMLSEMDYAMREKYES